MRAHRPVMLAEVLVALDPMPDGIFVDCTFGRGGHARAILERLGPRGRVLAIDRDPQAVQSAEKLAAGDRRLEVVHASFSSLSALCIRWGVMGQVNGVLLDLGVSSPQLDAAERGFSFMRDGPLDMRMDPGTGPSAAEWLGRADEREIAEVLKGLGEERYARRIARAIVAARGRAPVVSTGQLAELVARACPTRERDRHPATRTFQAIRLHINRELEELGEVLRQVPEVLAPGGRLAVISFHSLEDRLVKRFIRQAEHGDAPPPGLPVRETERVVRLRALGRARRPSAAEVAENPRARSAILRVAQRPR